jgi:hypothetical protein
MEELHKLFLQHHFMGLFNTMPFQIIKEVRVSSIVRSIEVMGILQGIVPFYRSIHLHSNTMYCEFVVHPLTTPISVELWMHLQQIGSVCIQRSMKDLKDLEGVMEVEEDTEVDELAEEDQFIATIVMSKDTWKETFHFQEDLGVHIVGITLMLLKTAQT